jgi:hypothetical protein
MKSNIRSQTGVVRDSRRPSVNAHDIRLVHRSVDPAEIVAINQIGIAIFAKGKH